MSLLAVQGGATGTGTVTLLAPVTNTNRTITLPDATGTVQVSGTAISGTTGTFSGGVVFGDATTQTTASTYIGGRGQVFTSSGTFTVPAGITAAKVTVIGGGGNGGGATGTNSAGGGGGGGGVAIEFVTGLTPGGTVTVTVGGVANTSSFGAYCSATGGATAATQTASGSGNGGAGGAGSGGDINITGGNGFKGSNISCPAEATGGGGGGSSGSLVGLVTTFNAIGGTGFIGGGGGTAVRAGSSAAVNGVAATGFGNGGAGGAAPSTADATGGAGSAGIVVVEF